MAVLYKGITAEASAEQTIEKSRFIAHVKPVFSREEAEAFIADIRSRYKDATHNVPAFVIGNNQELAWGSEDGEPSGTSAAPMVSMIKNMGLTNMVVVVTRYFGGVKLGPGGLIRAYTGTLRLALEKTEIKEFREEINASYSIPYTLFDKVKYLSQTEGFKIMKTNFAEGVIIDIKYDKDLSDRIEKIFKDLLKK